MNGKIIDEITGEPIQSCSVYFSNTTKGDVSSAKGEFILKNLQPGKYDLVISAIGYTTKVISVSSNSYPHDLEIALSPLSTALSEVIVQPFLEDGWQRWGKLFLENFIGTDKNAAQCTILNHDIIKFWFSEKTNRLTARADEPLVIENKALGYKIKFRLEEFSSDFNSDMVVFLGYPLFEEMRSDNNKRETVWSENRRNSYYGSVLEFMRVVYSDNLAEAGYTVISRAAKLNLEKQRVKNILAQGNQADTGKNSKNNSESYFKRVLKQPDSLASYMTLNSLDSMMVKNEDFGKSLFFQNKLIVVYKKTPHSKGVQSGIYLSSPEPIIIEKNGSYSSPKELVTSEHWATSEKISNLLPFDYEPFIDPKN